MIAYEFYSVDKKGGAPFICDFARKKEKSRTNNREIY